jgi:aminopeptidase
MKDMTEFQTQLKKYAEVAVKVGINLQKGQNLVIMATISAAPYVREVVKAAYEAGAKDVFVRWDDDQITRIRYDMAPMEAFEEAPLWLARGFEEMAASGHAFLSVLSPNPELLKGVDPKKIATSHKVNGEAMRPFSNYIKAGKVSWSIVAVPNEAWAAKVFPDLDPEAGIAALWDQIFRINRITTPDPIKSWEEHIKTLHDRCDFLNEKRLKKLHYRAPGTDLTIELADRHIWLGGAKKNTSGVPYTPNLPTEEVFCAPKKTGVNGTVKSTKPLNYGGQLIEGMSFVFENGKIVDFKADKGYDILKNLVDMDEGARYLGEVALVPHRSPISDTGLLFYNTLFDENASCHLAIGSAYAMNIEGGTELDDKGLEEAGLNTSITHVDFMIGSDQLDIDGETENGETIAIFRNGNWAI